MIARTLSRGYQICFLMLAGAFGLHAGIIYEFSGVGVTNSEEVSFQITLPDYVTASLDQTVTFACSDLDFSLNCDSTRTSAVYLTRTQFGAGNGYVDTIQFQSSSNSGYWFYFQRGSFDQVGVYQARQDMLFNPGTLVVAPSEEPGPASAAPEPASALLSLTGCGLLGLFRKRLSASRLIRLCR